LKDLGRGGGGGGGEWSKAYQKGFGYYIFISSLQLPERGYFSNSLFRIIK
jgi:hypothetical protein